MGLYLRRVVLQYPRPGWQVSTGISGSFQSESVATFDWNRWQVSTGISGNLRAEYARHGRKSRSLLVDGYKRHVLRDLDSRLIVQA